MLSSCPGKKVRLTGPIRGRSAVYRDLDTDLPRIGRVGACCIVWLVDMLTCPVYSCSCLDDEEFEFLRTRWSDYVSSAHQTGMVILLILLPEGLTSLSLQSLDESLT
ncbi:hypothetical protein DFJ58DRAFT_253355 [Suillus subalutaceus]|uniref:uncharacterized protein n=1 Tax=Suillus subalutaceus TaxID=48586 RepID=UPI001B85B8AF|nr:uncharacterized protein DFJ58DRAFT_253355 [Suillus subalutaceus]KAG1875369.1 hypothetical protein DFJ58DRAFT_253355 [Suillus subalutaceus]